MIALDNENTEEFEVAEKDINLVGDFDPNHYSNNEIECVDYLYDNMPREAFIGGLEFAMKKYLHRWRYKEKPVQDLRKARDFLSVLIDVVEGNKPEFKEWK